jgi:hypothetical protein
MRRGLALAVVGVVMALLAGGLVFRLSRPSRPLGDPEGRILEQLRPVSHALPPTATVGYAQFDEPHWDSWDGEAGTFGWSDVVTQIGFSWSGTPSALIGYANAKLTRLGWDSYVPTIESGVPGGSWTKRLKNGTEARTQLSVDADGSGWTLIAQAPPRGPRAG